MHIKLSVSLDEKNIAEIQKKKDGEGYKKKNYPIKKNVKAFFWRKKS